MPSRRPAPRPDASRPKAPRATTRRAATLPSGRAVVGGLVVAASALALYGIGSSAASPPRTSVLATTRPIAPGASLVAGDVTTVEIDAPSDTVDALLTPTDLAALEGAVALGPLPAHGLLLRSQVRTGADSAARAEVAVPVAYDRALAGDVQPGEQVVVLATFGSGTSAWTEVVADRALVRQVEAGDDRSIAGAGATTMLLAFDRRATAIAVAHAARSGELTLIRADGSPGTANSSDEADAEFYRPDAPPTITSGSTP